MISPNESSDQLKILLCEPRGFCAGVDRAIKIVEAALEKYGAPVYVRHEIVHNRYVVDDLASRGAVFVDELSEIPDNSSPVIFSAHGVPPRVVEEAKHLNLVVIDAVCPLVSKVHLEAIKYNNNNYHIAFIGHAGHPEVEGTLGQVPASNITLIDTQEDALNFNYPESKPLACLTQTTLSIDDTAEIVQILRKRFPNIVLPGHEDICYATTNRQEIVKQAAKECDHFIIVGSVTSSNSQRLVEVAQKTGCNSSILVDSVRDLDFSLYQEGDVVGLSAGASAPDMLVSEVIEEFNARFKTKVQPRGSVRENLVFKLPSQLSSKVNN